MNTVCFDESGTENISLETKSIFSLREREKRERGRRREEGRERSTMGFKCTSELTSCGKNAA
jgi:hypothetical protein